MKKTKHLKRMFKSELKGIAKALELQAEVYEKERELVNTKIEFLTKMVWFGIAGATIIITIAEFLPKYIK